MTRLLLIILSFLWYPPAHAQAVPPAAGLVLQAAKQQAMKEHKSVLLQFSASWCVWCHKMDASLEDPACREFFNRNFIVRHLTVFESPDKKALENPGAETLLNQYHGKDQGIPYWIVFDPQGNFLADARLPSGSSTGCPAEPEEVDYFVTVLKKAATLSAQEEAAIRKRFLQNR
jgi:thiol:disulfide interchange protein